MRNLIRNSKYYRKVKVEDKKANMIRGLNLVLRKKSQLNFRFIGKKVLLLNKILKLFKKFKVSKTNAIVKKY